MPKEKSNPTCASPLLYRTTCSNLPIGGVGSQRRRATNGDGGARQVEFGRCRVSAFCVCQAPDLAEALGNMERIPFKPR